MPEKEIDVEVPSQPKVVETGLKSVSTEPNILNWLRRHILLMAKGLFGLAALGGIGFLAKGVLFGGKRTNGFSAAQEDEGLNRALTKYEGKKSFDFGGADKTVANLANRTDRAIADEKINFSDGNTGVNGHAGKLGGRRLLSTPPEKWVKTFGGTGSDIAYSILQDSQGNYIVGGYTRSFGAGQSDFYALKLKPSGDVLWGKTFGWSNKDYGYVIEPTNDGGYIMGGETFSVGAGDYDILLIKIDSAGNPLWSKTFGGSSTETFRSIKQASDGSYFVGADTISAGAGGTDMLIFKLDSSGNTIWAKTFGGSGGENLLAVVPTDDGGCVGVGQTSTTNPGYFDALVFKLDSAGNKLWAKNFGGASYDTLFSILVTSDGYIASGYTYSATAGYGDIFILRLNNTGGALWIKTLGKTSSDYALAMKATNDGGYIMAGTTASAGGGDWDALVLKVDSSGNTIWGKTLGGKDKEQLQAVQPTLDGGYIVAGYTRNLTTGIEDMLVAKLGADGAVGCWAQDASWATVSRTLPEGNIPWETQNVALTVSTFSSLVVKNQLPTVTTICQYTMPIVSNSIAAQALCCSAGIGQLYNFTFAGNTFTDADGNFMTYTATQADGSGLPTWLNLTTGTRTFSGTPISNSQAGTLNIKVTANDGLGGTATDTFTLQVANTLSATNIGVTINYLENTAYNLDPIMVTTPSATAAVQLTLSNPLAGSLTTGSSGGVTATYNTATGVWYASGNKTEVNILLANLKYQPAADYHGAFTIVVSITDSYGQSLSATLTAPELVPPTLVSNTTRVPWSGSVILTTSMLSANDPSVSAAALVFTVSNVQHGRFELVSNPGMAITSFTLQQILNGQVRLVQDGSNTAATFDVKVSNGKASTPLTSITTNINYGPTLVKGEITIGRKEALIVTTSMLDAADPDDSPSQLTFSITNLVGGRFELSSNPGIPIASFTLQQIIDQQIKLVQLGSDSPVFYVSVSDGQTSTASERFTTTLKKAGEESSDSSLTTILSIAGGVIGIVGIPVISWFIKREVERAKVRKKNPLANVLRNTLGLDARDFEENEGLRLVTTADALAKELSKTHEIDANLLGDRELKQLSVALSAAIRKHTRIIHKGSMMFRSNVLDHSAIQTNLTVIVEEAVALWKQPASVETSLSDFVVVSQPIEKLTAPVEGSSVKVAPCS